MNEKYLPVVVCAAQDKLAAKLEKVRERLAMGGSNVTRPGADLIAWYLNPDRLPVTEIAH